MWPVSIAAVAVIAVAVSALVSAIVKPVLHCHDEFSYLLAADTLLHGRLANPTPDAWQSLQSLHVIMQPKYVSKYPLGVGFVVAIGISLFDNPLVGSWLSAAALSAACTWMLAGAVSRQWSLMGGLLIALHPTLQVTWSQSLLQGYLVATGCALLTGGVLRLRRRVTYSASFICGLGVAVLALLRPFEGLVCTVLCASALAYLWSGKDLSQQLKMGFRIGTIAMLPILIALAGIVVQNHIVTGNWWKLPYQLYESQFGVAPLFVFSAPRLENSVHRADLSTTVLHFHSETSLDWYRGRIGWRGWRLGCSDLFRVLLVLGLPFAALMLLPVNWLKFRVARVFLAAVTLQIAASGCVCWVFSHYAAPLLPWLLLLSLMVARAAFRRYTCSRKFAWSVGGGLLAFQVAILCLFTYQAVSNQQNDWARQRQRIVDRLNSEGGKHLVLVRYAPTHNVHEEWVYNGADPRAGFILWARDERQEWTRDVLKHYGDDRRVWELDADRQAKEDERSSSIQPGYLIERPSDPIERPSHPIERTRYLIEPGTLSQVP